MKVKNINIRAGVLSEYGIWNIKALIEDMKSIISKIVG